MFGCELKSCIKVDYTNDYFNNNHTHPNYELVYYYMGTGTVTILGKPYPFAAGTYSVSKPEHYHSERGVAGTKLIYISFTLKGQSISEGVFQDHDGTIGTLIKECYTELKNRKPIFQLFLNNLAERILLTIMRTDLKQKRANEDHFPYILNYIDTVYNLNISVKEIAKNIGYSYDYFRELFQERMGISVKEYLLNKKLGYAKALLVSTDYTLAEIASMSGFSSASHLCLVFRSKVGKTPLEYLKTHPKDDYNSEQYYLTEAENAAHLHTKSKRHPAIR